jgi:rhodanese-related sulfurtransferase/DNA-binding transcriptional ArsR family regulator
MTENSRKFKSAVYEQLARVGKAVSNPARLELLDLLSQGPRTVEALAREANLGVANTSQHLKALRSARLVEAEKSGLFVTYQLADQGVSDFLRGLRVLAEARLAEIHEITRAFFQDRRAMEPVDRDALLAKVRAGAVTVLDVRPVEEYQAGHIPGALSVPLKDLEQGLSGLRRDREIVAYCRGPYCVLAVEAVEKLRALGFRAFRMEHGVADWRALGLPIEITSLDPDSPRRKRARRRAHE